MGGGHLRDSPGLKNKANRYSSISIIILVASFQITINGEKFLNIYQINKSIFHLELLLIAQHDSIKQEECNTV